VPMNCAPGHLIRWKYIQTAFLPATTVCLLETEHRIKP
jgi:hypothetical protein